MLEAARAGFDPVAARDELETIEADPNLYNANAPNQELLSRRRDVLLSQLFPGFQNVGA